MFLDAKHPAAMTVTNPVLELEGVSAGYGNIVVLRDINLRVEPGQIVAIVGANGAGKTTLLKTISGVLRNTTGTIRFLAEDVSAMPTDRRTRLGIGHVPEGRRVFGPMSVADNLRLGAYGRKGNSWRADLEAVYELFPVLRQRQDLAAGVLSGGQQQMLAMGRALMTNPKVLLLDEPSMGLAPLLVQQIFEIIRSLKDRGIPLLLVEQNANAALAIADQGYVLETGQITLQGSGQELLKDQRVREAYLGI